MRIAKCFNYLFSKNGYKTYGTGAFLLERCSFLSGTMCQYQLQSLPNTIISANPKVVKKEFFSNNFILASLISRKNNNAMPSIYCSIPRQTQEDQVIHRIVDMYIKTWMVLIHEIKSCTHMSLKEIPSCDQKR